MKIPEKILAVLRKEKIFLIASHINPDGDAIGSALALSMALESVGKKTFIYNRDSVPKNYRFLPGHYRFTSDLKNILKLNPVLVLLDCNSPDRAELEKYEFRNSIVIDHHETEKKGFNSIKWIDKNAAATGMMIFQLIKALNIKFTKNIATNLYAAISVDTGTFRYSNTYADVLKISAELIDSGAEPDLISNYLYETWNRKRFNLLIMALNTLEIKNRVAIIYITKDMFKKTGTKYEDTENFSNFPRMIDSVNISALFREIGREKWRVSLRSKGGADVAKIAEYFDGGGHKNAAGFSLKADLKSAKGTLIKTVRRLEAEKLKS